MAFRHPPHHGSTYLSIFNAPPKPVLHLPREIVYRIFTYLPTEEDLKSAVLSNKMFFLGFSIVRQRLIAQVRLNSIDMTVLRLAYTAVKAQGVDRHDKKAVKVFLTRDISKYPPAVFTLEQMFQISTLYRYLKPLSVRFALWAISQAPGYPSEATGPPSSSELSRIQRAMLLFHIISRLIPIPLICKGAGKVEKDDEWFDKLYDKNVGQKLADWELRQLRSVRDFFLDSCREEYDILVPIELTVSSDCGCKACISTFYYAYITLAGIPTLFKLLNGRASYPFLSQDGMALINYAHHGCEVWTYYGPPGDPNLESQFTPEDTDVGPALMWNWGIHGSRNHALYLDANPNCWDWTELDWADWEDQLSMFWDLERMEVMTKGQCSCVDWDRDEDGPAWPEWNGFDD